MSKEQTQTIETVEETKKESTKKQTKKEQTAKQQTNSTEQGKDTYTKPGKVVECDSLNVRAEAVEDAEVIRIIKRFETVSISDESSTEDFYAVRIGETKGFCKKEFIGIE